MMIAAGETVLAVRNLRTYFYTDAGTVKSVDGVSFELKRGEILAVVGESGSGKSVTSLSIMRLLDSPGKIAGGTISFTTSKGVIVDLGKASELEMRKIRGNEIAMIFQEPMTSLNPVYRIVDQITETIILHQQRSRKEAVEAAVELLKLVGVPEPAKCLRDYPHQLSGGMRQRVMIAIALSCGPAVLIADEPTTALDVTVQAQILDLLRNLQQETGMSILFITHNLGVVREVADRVVVMYGGRVVEDGAVSDVFERTKHPYTLGLLNSLPRLDAATALGPSSRKRLDSIPGTAPNPLQLPSGCAFAPRCRYAIEECWAAVPALEAAGQRNHTSRCIRHGEL